MTETPTEPRLVHNPPSLAFGFVTGRFVTAIADTPRDTDRDPDIVAIEGTVKFTPLHLAHLVTTGGVPATVVKQPVFADVDQDGFVTDVSSYGQGHLSRGIYLAVGRYRVEPQFPSITPVAAFTVEVTGEHTQDNPLDLTLAAPVTIPPQVVEVTRVWDRQKAEEAAERAEAAAETLGIPYLDALRAEAAESARIAAEHSGRVFDESDKAARSAVEAQGYATDAEGFALQSSSHSDVSAQRAEDAAGEATRATDQANVSASEAEKSRTQADRSKTEADRSESEADRSESEADRSKTEADRSKTEADRGIAGAAEEADRGIAGASEQADRASDEADRAETAASNADDNRQWAGTHAGNAETQADRAETEADRSQSEADRSNTQANRSKTEADKSAASATQAATRAGEALTHRNTAEGYRDELVQMIDDGTPGPPGPAPTFAKGTTALTTNTADVGISVRNRGLGDYLLDATLHQAKSAYDTVVDSGYTGSEDDFADSLLGRTGEWVECQLLNGWGPSGAERLYSKVEDGVVHLSGRIANGDTSLQPIAQLPAGHEPARLGYRAAYTSNHEVRLVIIDSSGEVRLWSSSTGSSAPHMYFDATFPARVRHSRPRIPGPAGKGAYEIAVEQGYVGTRQEFEEAVVAASEAGERVRNLQETIVAWTTLGTDTDGVPYFRYVEGSA